MNKASCSLLRGIQLVSKNELSLNLHTNPGIIGWDLGFHVQFINGDPDGITYIPVFESPHVNVLNRHESTRAYARWTTLLRLVNGLRLVLDNDMIVAATTLYFDNGFNIRGESYSEDLDIILEELSYPFDEGVLSMLKKRDKNSEPDRYKDYLQLIIDEPIVREVIILLTLAEEQIIYLLINTYKIFENILSDLGLGTSKLNTNKKGLPEDLFNSLKELNEFTQYINSRDGSGILCRHGATKKPAPAKIPTREEIRTALTSTIDEWLIYKCTMTFGRTYRKRTTSQTKKTR